MFFLLILLPFAVIVHILGAKICERPIEPRQQNNAAKSRHGGDSFFGYL